MCRGTGTIDFDPAEFNRPSPCWDCRGTGAYPAAPATAPEIDETYVGVVLAAGCVVRDRRGLALRPRLDLHNHSPSGFAWGYGGSGPAQLALAVMADSLGDDDLALCLYQDFKTHAVSRLPSGQSWRMHHRLAVTFAEVWAEAREDRTGAAWRRWQTRCVNNGWVTLLDQPEEVRSP